MVTKREFADEFMKEAKARNKGLMLSFDDIIEITGRSRTTISRILNGCDRIGKGTGATFFYKDVAYAIMDYKYKDSNRELWQKPAKEGLA